jgi:serine protease
MRSLSLLAFIAVSSQASDSARYLVQFRSPQTAQQLATRLRGGARDLRVFPGIDARLLQVHRNLGMAEVVATASQARALAARPDVAYVEQEFFVALPPEFRSHRTQAAVSDTAFQDQGEITWGLQAVRAPQAWDLPNRNTIAGRGARVLVLDTGIDRQHSDLSSRFEKGRNFYFAQNLQNEAAAALPRLMASVAAALAPPPSFDNHFEDAHGHGTHVSGTIAGAYNRSGVAGVAPQARLLMGKVCGDEGCTSIGIIRGIEWGISEGVDVINMSLGGGMPSQAARDAVARADAAGVVVVSASGNDGSGQVSYPGAYENGMAVGAVDSSLSRASFSQYGPELDVVGPGVDVRSSVPRGMGQVSQVLVGNREYKSETFRASAPLLAALRAPMAFAGLGTVAELQALSLSGRIALISRGEISFGEKASNAAAAGAIGVIIFNNAPGAISGTAAKADGSDADLPVLGLSQADGEALKTRLASNSSLVGQMGVLATDYDEYSGTSMATPHVAGVAALVAAANPRLSAPDIRALLAQTATRLQATLPNEYGAGLVDAEAAVREALARRLRR